MPARRKGWACSATVSAVALAMACVPITAHAHETGAFTPEGEAAAAEVAALGPEHAAEHAAAPSSGPEALAAMSAGPSITPPNTFTGGDPDRVGRWVGGPRGILDLPNYAIHAVLVPTGKVLFWGYPPTPEGGTRPNGGQAALWDPSRGTAPDSITEVDPPLLDPDGPGGPQGPVPAPLYCSGETLLPNGDVLAVGGNLVWPASDPDDAYDDYAGLNTIYVFDPFAERWVRQPDMAGGRWYPSQVLLGDGRTAILGGYTEAKSPSGTPATNSRRAEVYKPPKANGGNGSVQTAASGVEFKTALYPHLFTLPNDLVLLAGPAAGDSARLSFVKGQPAGRLDIPWPPDGANRIGGNAVLDPAGYRGSWSAVQLGGFDDQDPVNPDADPADYRYRALATSVRTDGKRLQTTINGPTLLRRSYANTVLLPDRSMVTIGGGSGRDRDSGNYLTDSIRLKRVELYDPDTGDWTLGPNQREYRAYHSTAVLLPDGRVWSAGDDYHTVEPRESGSGYKASTKDTAEIYKPPYLFAPGRRPRIRRVASEIGYGQGFGIRTARGRGKNAVLMAPSATTHGADMHQRLVTLKRLGKVRHRGLNMKTPKIRAVAPPGYYMLFVLNGHGKPSIARWVKLDPKAAAPKLLKQRQHRNGKKGKNGKQGGKGKKHRR